MRGASLAGMAYREALLAAHPGRVSLYPSDAGVRVDFDALFAGLPPGAVAYVCGPMRMLDAARQARGRAGRRMPDLRFETFGSSGHFAAEAFTVRLPRLGREVLVPAHVSMLDALEAAGIGVLADCRRGGVRGCACSMCSGPTRRSTTGMCF